LRRYWAVLAVLLASIIGSLTVLMLVRLVDQTSRREFLARVADRPDVLFEGIAALVAGAGFAWFCLRQSRKDLHRD
jgi:hypothetical protein